MRRLSPVVLLVLAVVMTWSPTVDPAAAGTPPSAQIGPASAGSHALGTPGTELLAESPHAPAYQASAADYRFLDTLKLPWRCGDREPRLLTLDWTMAGHAQLPFSLDLAHSAGGEFVRGTEVLAPTSGTVTKATTPVWMYGYWVQIDAGNGWQVFIAHLNGPSMAGPRVSTGDVVGKLGSSGTEEAHIHIEVRENGGKPDVARIERVYGRPRDDFRYAPNRTFTSNNCPTPPSIPVPLP